MTLYYVSSKLKHADLWRKSGLNIISSWISNEQKFEDPIELGHMWQDYFNEIGWADAFALYLEPGDVPKGALIEMGFALAICSRIFIVWSGSSKELENVVGTVIHSELVRVVPDMKDLPQ